MADNNTTLRKIKPKKHGYYSYYILYHGNHKLIMVLLHDIVSPCICSKTLVIQIVINPPKTWLLLP